MTVWGGYCRRGCDPVSSWVQFLLCFGFIFAILHKNQQKQNKIAPRMKVNHNIGEQRVVQWWEHSSPTNVAQVQILSISDIIMLVEFVVG